MTHHLPRNLLRRQLARPAAIAVLTLLAGCSSAPPLMFADNITMGLQLGNATTAAGGSVSLGYKHQSLAVVPVSTLDKDGKAKSLHSTDVQGSPAQGERKDALSVFAVFETNADQVSPFRVGQTFATGLAAQRITAGYACKLGDRASCNALTSASAAASSAASDPPSTAAASNSLPYQYPLVYARSDVVGLDIGGSSVEQGMAFTFGFGSRNLAIVPVVARNADGSPNGLKSSDRPLPAGQGKDMDVDKDAFSVLGQFATTTELKGLGFCLERYFATGMAAQNLGQGLAAAAASAPAGQPARTCK